MKRDIVMSVVTLLLTIYLALAGDEFWAFISCIGFALWSADLFVKYTKWHGGRMAGGDGND
jgi:hypothetical protein